MMVEISKNGRENPHFILIGTVIGSIYLKRGADLTVENETGVSENPKSY